jgi:hypothetical protein
MPPNELSAYPASPRKIANTEHSARCAWPADCHIQGGGDGLVLCEGSIAEAIANPVATLMIVAGALGGPVSQSHYRTAFFEAFPAVPKTFIRGEGTTIAEAERHAWAQFERIRGCGHHKFERRGYRTGAGVCRTCGLFSSEAFNSTLDPCVRCGRTDNRASYGVDKRGHWHCPTCYPYIPDEDKSDLHKMADRLRSAGR